jgi:4-amino-4-deoxy-L-arabinose transferase-like glycosyltransferase
MSRRGESVLAALKRVPSGPALLAAIGVWLGLLAGLRPLVLPDEGRYAGIAWDMFRSGTVAVPLINGMPYFHKPPLYYWITEIAYGLFGLNEWAARLPSWMGAMAAILGVYLFVRRYRNVETARIAVVVMATMPFFFGGSQFANMDMLVAGTMAAATLAGAAAVLEHQAGRSYARAMLAAGVLAALAVLSKGLIGAVLPVLTLLAWLAVSRQWHSFKVLVWPPAIAIFLLVGAPWFVLMQLRYPGFFHYFFIYQQFDRFSETGFNNVQPFWFYLPVVVGLCLPWALWGGAILRREFWACPPAARSLRLLMAVWIVVMLGFFSIPSSKLIGYVVGVVPPLAVLLAEVLMRSLAAQGALPRRALNVSLGAGVAVCLAAMALAGFYTKGSATVALSHMQQRMAPADTLVSLKEYPFDLAFYAHAAKPMWVVDDWTRPDVASHDTWRKELFDAAQFAPAAGASVLVSPRVLQQDLCMAPDGIFWFWGTPSDPQRYPVLAYASLIESRGERAVWRLDVDEAFKAGRCGGMPTGGLAKR